MLETEILKPFGLSFGKIGCSGDSSGAPLHPSDK